MLARGLSLGKSRLEALSDGVFAIAMTLLVLELKVPEMSHHHSNAEMLDQLLALVPAFLSYVLTFLIAGGFWFLHHVTFHFIRHTDRLLCWINLLFLMFVSLLPFSAGLLGHLLVHPVSQLFYFGNQFLIAILLNAHWHYAIHQTDMGPDVDSGEMRRVTFRVASTAVAFASAFLAAMVHPLFSLPAAVAGLGATTLGERLSRARR